MQNIETFKLVELDGGLMPGPDGAPRQIRTDLDEELEAAREDVRLFGVFLDDYHVRVGTSMAARQQIARFIETQLGPSDMVGVMYPLQPVSTIRFTRNHDAVSRGIQQFLGRKYDYTPKNAIEERYAYYPTETVERIRNQVSLSAVEGMIVHMGTLKEGRKRSCSSAKATRIWCRRRCEPDAACPARQSRAQAIRWPGRTTPTRSGRVLANSDIQSSLREVFAAANRHNVAIYAIDPRGLTHQRVRHRREHRQQARPQYLNSTMDTLRQLSEKSDGRAIVNQNDITAA